jgi:hypothetical protein
MSWPDTSPDDRDPAVRRSPNGLNEWCELAIRSVIRFLETVAVYLNGRPALGFGAPRALPGPDKRKIKILMLGYTASGKTLMLAALFQRFKLGGGYGITLIPDDVSERELSQITKDIQDTSHPYLPEGTGIGMTKEWRFDVRVDWEDTRESAFELAYLDYAGEHLKNLTAVGQQEDPDEQFMDALRDADVVMGVLDGSKVLRLMTDGYSDSLVTEIEQLLRLLVLAEQKSVHLVISKWDLLTDRAGHPYTKRQVVGTLESYSSLFRDFLAHPRFKSMKIIPVAALGTGLARPDPDDPGGKKMIKVPGARWNPDSAAMPFYCAIPDIIQGDVKLLAAHADDDHGPKASESTSIPRLSWVTFAAAAIAGVTLSVTSHGVTAALPFVQIIDRIREALDGRAHERKPLPYDPGQAALARVLRVCYENADRYMEQGW